MGRYDAVWQLATTMHWTTLNRVGYVLSYFLPIFAGTGFLLGLIPSATRQSLWRPLPLHRSFPIYWTSPGTERRAPGPVAWLPVTVAFLIRFATWKSQASSVFDTHRSVGRIERFFGPLYGQNSGLLDSRWITDRFLFTGPMLFLIACALAALLRYKLTAPRRSRQEPSSEVSE